MPTSYVPVTTTGAVASGLPWLIRRWRSVLPDRCSCGASGFIAASASVSGGSTSYSTLIAFTARRAVSGSSAATIAIASPW